MNTCLWCDAPMPPKDDKIFCCTSHRARFHTSLRLWARRAFADGLVEVSTLRRIWNDAQKPCTAKEDA